jgi:1-deoxy-D-xylulose-5-phosphate reductoisomerase
VVGAAGLRSTLAALERGGILAFANKESLVCAGAIVLAAARRSGATLLPVDSEHNAIFQALDLRDPAKIEKIVLTASGGPCRAMDRGAMRAVTPEIALRHPVWKMGAKISIDSATMMNKGLELIEAAHLFPVPESRIEVLVHPQSAVHGLVQYADGSLLAQLDLAALGRLEFLPPDPVRFPALRLARDALRAGGGAPVVLNAANEVAVALFLDRRLGFLDIAAVVEEALDHLGAPPVGGLDDVLALDAQARREAMRMAAARHAAA